MDTTSESNSVTPTSVKTPNSILSSDSKRQVGFSTIKPRLIIPPPAEHFGGPPPSQLYFRKQFGFNLDHQLHEIKDFTKAGLGVGEKCAFWFANKIKKWSRRWFTHMFLTIILVLYTVGGAFLFEHIEGKL